MAVNWNEVQKDLSPLKDYEDCCRRFSEAFSYSFVCKCFNYSMPEMIDYTQKLLLGDARGRYVDYNAQLVAILSALDQANIQGVQDLATKTSSRNLLESFVTLTNISAVNVAVVLKYLVYWFIPNQKYLSGLVREGSYLISAIQALRECGVRTNLDMLEKGINSAGRKSLAEASGLPAQIISELVNRADFSRLPWSSKATISNIIGAGYPSLARLRNADPGQLYEDFFAYGKKIGKNLKLGNEIENSYRIAKIVPVLLDSE
jgi:hypothetical protein